MTTKVWKKYPLSDIAEIIGGGTPRTTDPDYWNGEIPWISVVDFEGDRKYIFSTEKSITEEGLRNSSTKILKKGSLIISARGTVGELGVLAKDMAFNQSCYGLVGKEMITNDFLYYLLLANMGQIKGKTHGAVFDTITRETFNHVEIPLPPMKEQIRITEILSAFDDKIELNRRMNETLEAIAQAIFKEWFIDFNFPGATGELVPSPLGPIPQGWRVGRLRELFKITMGQSPPGVSYNENENGIPFFQGRSDFGFRFPTKRLFTTNPKRFAQTNDTLVSVRAPVGDMNVAIENCCIGRGLAAVIERGGNSTFTYYFLKQLTGQLVTFEDNGTVFGSITKNDFENIQCVIPPTRIINVFESVLRPFDDSILTNYLEDGSLKAIRELLLARFMRRKQR